MLESVWKAITEMPTGAWLLVFVFVFGYLGGVINAQLPSK